MAPTVAIPSSGGKNESCANRAQGVELCSRATNLGVDTRPSPLVLQMGPVARDVCLAVGSDHFFWPDGIMEIPQALHDYFAPPALDSVYREVARFLQLKRAAQTMGAHLVRFDLLRMGVLARKRSARSCVCAPRPFFGPKNRWVWQARAGIREQLRRQGG